MHLFTSNSNQITPIILPILDRHVQLGYSVYNYAEDTVTRLHDLKTTPFPEIRCLSKSTNDSLKVKLAFSTSENLNEFKWKQLQLNSHLRSSILTGLLPGPFWFSEFLDVHSEAENAVAGKILAKIAVHVLVQKPQENKLSDKNLKEIKKEINSRKDFKNINFPVYVISGLVYGFNAILTFEIEVSNLTEKKDVEACLYQEAKRVFSELTQSTSNDCQSEKPVVWLKKAKFQFFYDRKFSTGNYEDILSQLKNAIKGDNLEQNVPLEMTLSPINDNNPTRDLNSDTFTALLHFFAEKSAINKQYHLLITDPLLIKIPHLKDRVEQFKREVVDEHFKGTSQTLLAAIKSVRKDNQTQLELLIVIEKQRVSLEELVQWFMARQQEMSVLRTLLNDIQIPWETDWQQFNRVEFQGYVRLFLFRVREHNETVFGDKRLTSTVYDIFSSDDNEHQKVRTSLLKFTAKIQKKNCSAYLSPSNCHQTGCALTINNQPETSKDDESVIEQKTNNKFETLADLNAKIVDNKNPIKHSAPIQSYQESNKSNSVKEENSQTFPNCIQTVTKPNDTEDKNSNQAKETGKLSDSIVKHNKNTKVAPNPPIDQTKPFISDNNYENKGSRGSSADYTNSKDDVSVIDRKDESETDKKKLNIHSTPTQSHDQNKLNSFIGNSQTLINCTKNEVPLKDIEDQHLYLTNKSNSKHKDSTIEHIKVPVAQQPTAETTNASELSCTPTKNFVGDDNETLNAITETTPTSNYTDISSNSNQTINSSIAKQFAERCQILEKGEPSIYMLEAHERISPNKNLRWFEILTKPTSSQFNNQSRSHKVLMLMGATGAGKSTLINGMINYILGVEWSDPFRFKIVKDSKSNNSSEEVNQAHSQTSCVTAYTIRHVEGMKISYDITIIDTPGYGDTRGIDRDKEITKQIEQFLVHPQTDKEFNFINAVCFVANAAESRLTPGQQYIFKSVTSIFGDDVRHNLRLLVTFSDGNKPPVLEAIRQANISGLGDQQVGSIEHHKFNSSALYAQNSYGGQSFQFGFWNLGMQNYKLFFEILATMPDRSWKQTRQVIHYRNIIENNLNHLSVLLVTWSEKNNQVKASKLKITDHEKKLTETYKCYELKRESIKTHVSIEGSTYFSYNCQNCKRSCKRIPFNQDRQYTNTDGYCATCRCHESKHDPESYEWVIMPDEDYENKLSTFQYCQDSTELAKKELDKHEAELVVLASQIMDLFKSIEANSKQLESSTLSNSSFTLDYYISKVITDLENRKDRDYSNKVKLLKMLYKKHNEDKIKTNHESTPRRSAITTV